MDNRKCVGGSEVTVSWAWAASVLCVRGWLHCNIVWKGIWYVCGICNVDYCKVYLHKWVLFYISLQKKKKLNFTKIVAFSNSRTSRICIGIIRKNNILVIYHSILWRDNFVSPLVYKSSVYERYSCFEINICLLVAFGILIIKHH